MDRDSATATATASTLRVTVACSPRAGVAAEVALELAAGATAIEAIRASGLLERFAELDLSVQAIGVWGRAVRARCAAARGRPGRDLPAAGDGPEPGAAAARAAGAGAPPALIAYLTQSLAITSLVDLMRSAFCLSSRNSRSPVFGLAWIRRMPLSSVSSWRFARVQFSARSLAIFSCSSLVLGSDFLFGLLALGFELGIGGARRRRRRGDGNGRGGRRRHRHRRAAAAHARPPQDVLIGGAGRRRQVAVLDVAALVLPLPLRLGGKGKQARREEGEQRGERSSHGRDALHGKWRPVYRRVHAHDVTEGAQSGTLHTHPYNSLLRPELFPCAFWAKR